MAKAKQKLAKRKAKPAPVTPVPTPIVVEATKPAPITIQINAKYLRAMRHVAAKNDIRYYLNGVLFQTTKDGGKFYVATDGHRIAVIHEPWPANEEPQDIAIIIPTAVAASAKPLLKKSSVAILKKVDVWTWTLQGGGDVQLTFKAIDGTFPDWKRTVPTSCSGKIGTYNWTYLHDMNLLAKEAFGRNYTCEVQHNGDGAAVVTAGSNSFLGLVMPLRMSEGTVPQWAVNVQKANAAKKEQDRIEAEARARATTPELAKAA